VGSIHDVKLSFRVSSIIRANGFTSVLFAIYFFAIQLNKTILTHNRQNSTPKSEISTKLMEFL